LHRPGSCIAEENNHDSAIRFYRARVPYPMGFFSRGMDGRIDNPNAGWKGRGVWATYGGDMTWHIEGGAGTKNKVVKFQLRPNPLAD
jgi:hypothetical protein